MCIYILYLHYGYIKKKLYIYDESIVFLRFHLNIYYYI